MSAGEVSGWLNILVVILGAASVIIGIRAKVSELVRAIDRLSEAVEGVEKTMNEHDKRLSLVERDVQVMQAEHRRRT